MTKSQLQRQQEEELWQDKALRVVLLIAFASHEIECLTTCAERFLWSRLCWEGHMLQLRNEHAFERFYRMTENAFETLLLFIRPKVECKTQ